MDAPRIHFDAWIDLVEREVCFATVRAHIDIQRLPTV